MKTAPLWDIYSQQPIMLYHPALADWNGKVMVAGVTPKGKGIIWWAAGYFVGEHTSGQPGSGFAEHPLPKKPKYVKDGDYWIIDDKEDGLYKFCLPDREMLAQYEKCKQYVPTMEKLRKYAENWTFSGF
jgi:hypothetical protein